MYNRVTGFEQDPNLNLSPITGISDLPLPTFTEAMELLHDIVPKLTSYIAITEKWASERSTFPHSLTSCQASAIYIYTLEWTKKESSLYHILNSALREKNREVVRPFLKYLRLLFSALSHLPKYDKTATVWRGIPNKDLSKDYSRGKKIIWWAFTSTTTNLDVLEKQGFLKDVGTLFNIHVGIGYDIREFSASESEDEILLPPGKFLEVLNVKNLGKAVIIELRELPSDFVDFPEKLSLPTTTSSKMSSLPITTSPTTTSSPSGSPSGRSRFLFPLLFLVLGVLLFFLPFSIFSPTFFHVGCYTESTSYYKLGFTALWQDSSLTIEKCAKACVNSKGGGMCADFSTRVFYVVFFW